MSTCKECKHWKVIESITVLAFPLGHCGGVQLFNKLDLQNEDHHDLIARDGAGVELYEPGKFVTGPDYYCNHFEPTQETS